jgi:cobalt/nickel transport system permease protein
MIQSAVGKLPRWFAVYYASLGVVFATTAMHIPDGYLSPATSLVMFALVAPFWVIGMKRMRETLSARSIPLVALLAAFSFVIMMFNVPLPGGTTGHAVGAALAAIVLGPQVATIAVSMALIIQAVLFGDGGILAIGANCFNMAVVMPYISYAIYQAIVRHGPTDAPRRVWGAAIGAYVGLAAAALLTAVQFGVQPALFHAADGTPLYAPYPLSVALPAMMIPHLLVAAVIEAALTAGIVAYVQRTNVSLLEMAHQPQQASAAGTMARLRPLWIGLAVLIVLSPIGLLAPGTAWGEWGAEELTDLGLGFVPAGLEKLGSLWGAPLPDYDLPALGNASLAYVLSAIIGIVVTVILVALFTMLLSTRRETVPAE